MSNTIPLVPQDETAIRLVNISKYYKLYEFPKYRLLEAFHLGGKIYHKKYHAIKHLNLEVKKGEILGIVGKNGSGKSTLLKLITGVLSPDEGDIQVNGKISALLELGSGFNPEFTGMQNIFFYGTILGFSRKEMNEKLNDILEFADIGDFIDQPLKTYSSGMRARLGFAVAVNIDPDILILDEVLSVGDILFKRKCYAKMKEFFDGGKTIIYVSHDSTSVKELCSRAIFLLDGGIAIDGDPKTVTHYYEKYQFSSKQRQMLLVEEMKHYDPSVHVYPTEDRNDDISSESVVKKDEQLLNGDEYLAGFVSKPSFGKSNLVIFSDYKIQNRNNIKVNVLQTEHIYTLSFDVKFTRGAEDIYFGAEFLSLKGNILSSVDTKRYKKEKVFSVQNGESYRIDIAFECLLLPDVYVVNIFARNEKGGLTIHDAYIFKVKPSSWEQGGIMSMKQTIEVKKLS